MPSSETAGARSQPFHSEDLEDLYEEAPCGYFSLCPQGTIVKVNATFCQWTGFRKDQILGRRLRDLLSIGGRIFYETHFAPLLRMQGFFNEVALDVVTAQGERLPVLANAKERRGEDGQLLFTRVTIFLAAERRRYERELFEAKTVAETDSRAAREHLDAEKARREMREQFIAMLGHDLRNPLGAVDAGIGMLMREPVSERAAKILRLMQGATLRMGNLIDNVLDFARGELGQGITVTPEAGRDLAPVLRQVVEEIKATVPGQTFDADIDIDAPVPVDHARIAQLLSNLVGNAVAHGAPDQAVRVRARIVDAAFELFVANGGDPIPPEAMQQLFRPFYRVYGRAKHQGLGLGLFIVNEIARAHGGRMEVASDASETRFTFRMPLSPGPEAEAAGQAD